MIWQLEMVMELKEAKPSARKEIITRYQGLYGFSDGQMYRIARNHGFDTGRKQRNDKGIGILALEQVEFIAALLYKGGRENKGAFMPIENALEIAIDNNIILRGEVSLSTVQRQLREYQMSKRLLNAPTPHTDMASLHPNHVHLVDVSTCIQYYLADGGLKVMREDEFYKNKLENFKKIDRTIQRYILVDHFSAFFFVHYYEAAGETALNLFDFLYRAWETKTDSRFAFRGVPQIMLMDGGCRAKAKALGAGFWEGIGVEIIAGTPGNSRRQGAVEVHHKIWEEWFETRLRFDPATSIEDLNRKAFGFCLWYNARKEHTRFGRPRLSQWLLIKSEQLREVPERSVLQDLMNKPEETRTVKNHRISFESKEFNLKHANIPHGTMVKIIKNIWKWQEGIITVSHNNQLFEAKAIETLSADQGGFNANAAIIGVSYKAQPETATQKAKKRLDELATGSREPGKDAKPFYGLNFMEGHADKVDNLHVFPKRGTPMELTRTAAPIQRPIMELFKAMRAAGIQVTPAINQALRAEYGDTISAVAMDTVIRQYSGQAPQHGLSLVVNK